MCPLTVHALFHEADRILSCGPVWAFWAFPMEHYCNVLKRALGKSRWFPYEAINRFVVEDAWLTQIKIYYGLWDVFSVNKRKHNPSELRVPACKQLVAIISISLTDL